MVDNYQLKCKDACKHTYCLEKQKLRELKEEFWEDKKLGEEELVKMGKIDNFQSLRGSLKRPKRKPHSEIQHLLPETRTRGAKREHIHES